MEFLFSSRRIVTDKHCGALECVGQRWGPTERSSDSAISPAMAGGARAPGVQRGSLGHDPALPFLEH